MTNILQAKCQNIFSWKKFVSWFKFHKSWFLGSNKQLFSTGPGNGLTPNSWQAVTGTRDAYRRHKASVSQISNSTCNLAFVIWCMPTTFMNSSWPCDAIWRYRSALTLSHVMAYSLTTPSHYLNKCWLSIIWLYGIHLREQFHSDGPRYYSV